MSRKKRFNNKKIAILGLGLENIAFLKFLSKAKIKAEITICDAENLKILKEKVAKIKLNFAFKSGVKYDENLEDFDIILRAPGYPLFSKNLIKAKKFGAEITSAMKLFFEFCPTKNIIGVTGSKGKGTTSSLIYGVIKKSGKKVFIGGNIGIAPFEFIDKIKAADFVVLELSSFQLEDLNKSPHIAVITNLFKEHLAPADPKNPNFHKSMKAYWEAKANIFKHQKKNDYLVANEKLDSRLRGNDIFGKIIFYSKSELPSNLLGEHNKENISATEAVAEILKIKKEVSAEAVKKFKGLPHRLELVAKIGGVKYFDDSFATVPNVSIIALKSFSDKQNFPRLSGAPSQKGNIILLAGGADKGSDFKNFAKEINRRAKFLILFEGKGSDKIKKEILNIKCQIPSIVVNKMGDALKIAKKQAKPGDVVLLSTGCASFGVFKNYKDRGDQFKKEVNSFKRAT